MLSLLRTTKPPVIPLLMACLFWLCVLGCESSDPESQGPSAPTILEAGRHKLFFDDSQLYYVYVSPKAIQNPEEARIIASIHGFSGRLNAQEGRQVVEFYRNLWENVAAQEGWVVVAPQFDEFRFDDDYQRLNPFGTRADIRLNDICNRLGDMIPGLPTEKILLFGFSGGGQFAHCYIAIQPERIERAVVASPGWYLWPDPTLPYPVGTDTRAVPTPLTPSFQALCDLPVLLVVGDADTVQGDTTNRENSGIDLIALQGSGRRAKAENWVAAVRDLAERQDFSCRLIFDIIPNTGHTISNALFASSADFLRGQE
ncbi:hypothetical protein C2W62_09580 [Candidatus Entotheonella serta]|nr:hypothetical protein C2W62_09580 [Candidatus Entotheonella serta]